MILLVDFAKERGVNPDTITTYIRRHAELFEGHTKQKGNKLLLDEEAVVVLDKKYPLPKLIEVVNGIDPLEYAAALKELSEVQKRMEMLQEQYRQETKLIEQAKASLLLLGDREAQIEKLEKHNEALETANEALRSENERLFGEKTKAEMASDMTERELKSYKKTWFGLYRKEWE